MPVAICLRLVSLCLLQSQVTVPGWHKRNLGLLRSCIRTNISSLTKTAQKRIYFLQQLKKFNLPNPILVNFYTAIIEFIQTSSITVQYATASAKDRARLQRIIHSDEKVIGCNLPSLQDVNVSRTLRRAGEIVADSSHPGHGLLEPLPSISCHRKSFSPDFWWPHQQGLGPYHWTALMSLPVTVTLWHSNFPWQITDTFYFAQSNLQSLLTKYCKIPALGAYSIFHIWFCNLFFPIFYIYTCSYTPWKIPENPFLTQSYLLRRTGYPGWTRPDKFVEITLFNVNF